MSRRRGEATLSLERPMELSDAQGLTSITHACMLVIKLSAERGYPPLPLDLASELATDVHEFADKLLLDHLEPIGGEQ